MLEGLTMSQGLSDQVRLKHDEATDRFFLFCIQTGEHFRLNRTGYDILTLLKEGKTREEMVSWLGENYDVDTAVSHRDVEDILNFLADKGLYKP